MKAIRVEHFGEPAVMQLTKIEGLQPAAREVVVQIQAAGVNPVDTYIRAGSYARKPDLPYTPGIDGAGVISAVGEGVRDWQVGDRVYGGWPVSGTYAQQALYVDDQVYALSQKLSFAKGAAIFVPYSTAYRALFHKGQAQPGETVLIHGATGSVGLAAVQLAKSRGLNVIGTGSSAQGRDLVAAQGADHVLDHSADSYLDRLREMVGGRSIDLILEMLANVNLGYDLDILAFGGRVVVIGSRGSVEINPRATMGKELTITGISLFNTPAAEMNQIQAALQAGLQNGTFNPIISQELSLAAAAKAHEQVMQSGSQGKIVLLPQGA
ncbi:MAG: NADPH:quinone reductase [Leptolyngbyaceae cyanobacterium SM1_1_3]|nr:NADPH:quinone reductase [Leptolyngbyaceae cyanobacterium SM1_1_3]NJN03022.1 NADPH:quinone reductase [Leptolyngbyaceae cyanobacterium RM1_1_2]NJO08375.1 NADPH:quinone reductase [Leptolyngbyaceae cyanobacterium SL_1_1]